MSKRSVWFRVKLQNDEPFDPDEISILESQNILGLKQEIAKSSNWKDDIQVPATKLRVLDSNGQPLLPDKQIAALGEDGKTAVKALSVLVPSPTKLSKIDSSG